MMWIYSSSRRARAEQYAAILSDIPDYCCVLFVYDTVEFKINGTMKKLAAAVKEHAQILSFGKHSPNAISARGSRAISVRTARASQMNCASISFFAPTGL